MGYLAYKWASTYLVNLPRTSAETLCWPLALMEKSILPSARVLSICPVHGEYGSLMDAALWVRCVLPVLDPTQAGLKTAVAHLDPQVAQ